MNASQFLQQLAQQPWYSDVRKAFRDSGISDPLWEATLWVEDEALNPAIAVNDHHLDGSPAGIRIGLFQIDPNGMGAEYGVTGDQLKDPVTNAKVAAARMAAQLAKEGTGHAPLYDQLRTIERAGWPGNDPNLPEDAQRQAALRGIVRATVPNALDGWDPNSPYNPAGTIATATGTDNAISKAAASAATAAVKALGLPDASTVQSWLVLGLIGSLLLGLMAGGFALLAAGQAERVAARGPVPVPV